MLSVAEFDTLAERVDNWKRWGADDQLGTLNFITPEVVRKATASVVTGETFSLSMSLSLDGPQQSGTSVPGRINPVRTMLTINAPMSASPDSVAYSDDIVVTPTQAGTHWDALSHCSHRGLMYNGVPADSVDASGATRLGIEAAGTIVSRGILLDVARHQGVDRLPGRFAVTRAVLEAVEAAQGTPVEEGDIVLVRTGQVSHFLAGDVPAYRRPVPALDYDAPLFLHERRAAAAAIDNMPMELLPSNVEDVMLPVHILCLVMMGMIQGQNWVLEDLAAACDRDRRYTFLLDATPERFLRSTGGMVNPVAIR
ncbi:cyclase family protein [Streptomyces sp. NPDC101234]|uniref:cyclase family protein n=1 Tax=Streptomyces sp. NPDC101234 TaxID=3366138 RepID=UPI00381EBAE9